MGEVGPLCCAAESGSKSRTERTEMALPTTSGFRVKSETSVCRFALSPFFFSPPYPPLPSTSKPVF